MGLKEDYRLKKLKKEMHRLHCEVKKCCDGEGGDGLTCEDLENCPEIIGIKNSIPEDISDLTDNSNLLFDGDYDSLSNKPTIPVVNDGQLELSTSGIATGGTKNFSANQSGNTTFTVNVPGTDITLSFNNNILTVSSSTGQSDSIDLSSLVTDNTYVTSMSLSGNTLILTNNDGTTVQQDLSSILFDGDYNNLSNKPTIPTNNSELVNDSGYLTCEDLENCQEIIDIKDSIPTDVSDLSDTNSILLEYKGEQSSAPLSPQKGWFYKNTVDGVMYYFDGTNWIAYAEGGGGDIFIERSLPDLHIDIANSKLVPGATYKITGVHKAHTVNGMPVPALYDDGRGLGTTIFLKAVSENKLESYGSGIFYNPNYDLNTPGYNIWTNKVFVTLSNVSGVFQFYHQDMDDNYGEPVTANNGAKGRILSKGQIVYVSGDWANATSITGDYSGATADIDSVSVPSYNVNDVVFWGGYAWENEDGNVGNSTDILNLDSGWEKLDYTDLNYNEVIDYIEYDIENDFITRRRNEEFNIDVNETFDTFLRFFNNNLFQYSSISVMNYGLGFSGDRFGSNGISGVKVNNSYVELVNFKGNVLLNVNFDNSSYFLNVNFNNGSHFQYVNFDSGSYFDNVNFDNNSYLQNANFDNNSRLRNVNFDNGSYFLNFNFDNNSYLQNVNFDNNSSFSVNFNNGSYFLNVNFDSFVISYSSATILDNKSIRYTDFKGVGLNLSLPDLSSATIIFDNNIRKEVIYIQGATNNCKLITYDTNGDRVVNDIDD